MLGKKRKSMNDSKSDKFLLKLYEILNDEQYNKIIHWSQNGSYIVISNVYSLTKKILPIFFNHQNYSSFVRQLNMYNFHKIRTNPDKNEQYFIHESLNKNKSLKEIKLFKRKTKDDEKNIKFLFYEDEDSKIKYTVLEKKKEEKNRVYDDLDVLESDEKKIKKFENIIKEGNIDSEMKKRMLLFLLNKTKENQKKENEFKEKLKSLSEQKKNYNSQIQNWNNELENQSLFLKKIKSLYIFLVSLLMRKTNNCGMIENKKSSANTAGKKKLLDFIHRVIDYNQKNRNRLSQSNNIKNKNNNIYKNKSLSNIVQKSEAFSINQENFSLDDYLNKFEILSWKSLKSGKLNDSFSFSAEDRNFNSSFSLVGNNNNLFDMNYNNNFNVNQNFLSDQNFITFNNNINNGSFFL